MLYTMRGAGYAWVGSKCTLGLGIALLEWERLLEWDQGVDSQVGSLEIEEQMLKFATLGFGVHRFATFRMVVRLLEWE